MIAIKSSFEDPDNTTEFKPIIKSPRTLTKTNKVLETKNPAKGLTGGKKWNQKQIFCLFV